MKLLLDTHILLWAAGDPDRLAAAATKLLESPTNELLFSPVSLWEVVIRASLGRSDFQVDPRALRRGLLENDYTELPVTSRHAVAVADLPPLHRDPFDRLLLAQAVSEGVTLVTAGEKIAQYPGPVRTI